MNNPLAARLLSVFRRLASARRIALARATGAEIGQDCVIAADADLLLGVIAPRSGRLSLGDRCELAQGVVLHPYGGSITLAPRVYLGQHTVIFGHGGVTIGPDTLVAMHCRIVSSAHPISPRASVIRDQPDILQPTRIGRDVWLGAGVTVLGGVTIGDGCVVGAGAVVTKDLPPFSISVGVPARVVGSRAD